MSLFNRNGDGEAMFQTVAVSIGGTACVDANADAADACENFGVDDVGTVVGIRWRCAGKKLGIYIKK